MRLRWLLGVRGKARRYRIADKSSELGSLSVLLIFAQTHIRHLIFKNASYLAQCTFAR